MGFHVLSIALVSTKIEPGFLLIFIFLSSRLFQVIAGNRTSGGLSTMVRVDGGALTLR